MLLETEMCMCDCHRHGMLTTESIECCPQFGSTYISDDGVIDIAQFAIAFRRTHGNNKPTINHINGKYYMVHAK